MLFRETPKWHRLFGGSVWKSKVGCYSFEQLT